MDEFYSVKPHAPALVELKGQPLNGLFHKGPAKLQIHFPQAPFGSCHGSAAHILPALVQEEVKNFLSIRAAVLAGHLFRVELYGPYR